MQPLTLQEFAQLQYPVSHIKIEKRWCNSHLYKHNSAHYLLRMYNVLCTLLHHITAVAKGNKREIKREKEKQKRKGETKPPDQVTHLLLGDFAPSSLQLEAKKQRHCHKHHCTAK